MSKPKNYIKGKVLVFVNYIKLLSVKIMPYSNFYDVVLKTYIALVICFSKYRSLLILILKRVDFYQKLILIFLHKIFKLKMMS